MSRSDEIVLRSPAKINWLLRVLGKRKDGFHEIETVFQTISLHDRITCKPAEAYSLSCSDPSIPVDGSNLVSRAVSALDRLSERIPRFAIHIEKSIPSGGGLGGGSSNAATILRELRDRFDPDITDDQLRQAALEIGSDVPFFLAGGTAYATGRGERLRPLSPLEGIRLLLILPEERVATGEAYDLLGRGRHAEVIRYGLEYVSELDEAGPLERPDELVNDFEEPVFARLPKLRHIRETLLREGAGWARMSGSGSTIVGAFRDEETRQQALRAIRGERVVPAESV